MLIEPFRTGLGASFVLSAFDAARDAPVPTKWITAPKDSLLIVDGEFLLRPELVGLWNYSVWVDVPADAAAERTPSAGAGRDSATGERYAGAQRLYRTEASPRRSATAIVDYGDPDHPRRVFADSC